MLPRKRQEGECRWNSFEGRFGNYRRDSTEGHHALPPRAAGTRLRLTCSHKQLLADEPCNIEQNDNVSSTLFSVDMHQLTSRESARKRQKFEENYLFLRGTALAFEGSHDADSTLFPT